MQKITTFLTFNDQAEEAANLYTSLFADSCIDNVSRYGEGAPAPAGSVMSVNFRLAGQEFIALNGGPSFKFEEGMSLFVGCEDQEEVDRLWSALTANGGEESMCGWLKDRFGVSWQIVPRVLGEMLGDTDTEKADRVMRAMLQMRRIDIGELNRAYAAL
jgi:predicted 3-demethylubiquinone-9 3-methyltransferase (glyoxalase superfamily)